MGSVFRRLLTRWARDYERHQLREEIKRLRAIVADYENTMTWETTCHNCAALLDSSIRETERAERAEAVVERVRSEIAAITAENDAYAVRQNPECECEVVETTRDVVERIREALGDQHRTMWRARTWRVGRKVGRTLYLQAGSEPSDKDMLIGVLDTVDLAARAVYAVNELTAREAADG